MSRIRVQIALCLLLSTLCLSKAKAIPADSAIILFEMANGNYSQGNYGLALEQYEDALSTGLESAELYFNLGNAYYKQASLCDAIWCYEQALCLRPGYEDADHNLRLANLQIIDKIEPLPEFFLSKLWKNVRSAFSSGTWSWLTVLFVWLAFAFLSITWLSKRKSARLTGLRLGIVLFTLALLFGIISRSQLAAEQQEGFGIIFEPNAYVKSAPDQKSADLFIVHEGLKVEELDIIGDWGRIKLADGKSGWLPRDTYKML